MPFTISQILLKAERDVVTARQRAREVAAALHFENQDQIRIATATSEMARNAFRYAKNGRVTFLLDIDQPQSLNIEVTDSGPGIANLDEILAGQYRSSTGLGMGITGTKKLMDDFRVETSAAGTTVRMEKRLSAGADLWSERTARELNRAIEVGKPEDPFEEIEQQNQELLKTLGELRARQQELELLNRELEDTNRGVVALYAELDERADYLRRASELKTKFLSNVSHEFRTPLNSIISLARLLMDRIDGDLSSEQLKQVRYIESSARDLQEMVNDLLDLAKVEAGKVRIRPKRFEVHELFSALKGMLKPLLADNTSIELIFEDASGIPALFTDEGKVSQILRNLISNALKFTSAGKVTVSAEMQTDNRVQFLVEDTGIGIAPENHESIFAEFTQVENPLQDRHRGTGLGLPLCRNLTILLGGSIRLESELGQGSRFYVSLPRTYVGESASQGTDVPAPPEFHRSTILCVEEGSVTSHPFEQIFLDSEFQPIIAPTFAQAESWMARHTPAAVILGIEHPLAPAFIDRTRQTVVSVPIFIITRSEQTELEDVTNTATLQEPLDRKQVLSAIREKISPHGIRRLLVVDDNEVSRYILRELLNQPWLSVQEASNGTEALQAVSEQAPDAVILDLLMPDMNGLEVLRQIRTRPETENLPVLIYTSKPLTDAERAQLDAWNAKSMRKQDVSSRLSAQPFLDWARSAGLSPASEARAVHE